MKIRTWIASLCLAAAVAVFASGSPADAKPIGKGSTPTAKAPKAKETHHAKAKTTKKSAAKHTHKAKEKKAKKS